MKYVSTRWYARYAIATTAAVLGDTERASRTAGTVAIRMPTTGTTSQTPAITASGTAAGTPRMVSKPATNIANTTATSSWPLTYACTTSETSSIVVATFSRYVRGTKASSQA